MFGKSYRKTPMKTLIQIKTTILSVRKSMRPTVAGFLIPLLLVCFAFMPRVQAADPDTILPNGNTAEGSGVLVSLTSGVWNSGFGFEALNHDTAGKDNTATGVRALFSNTSGSNNTATGVYALYGNTTGWYNSAVGAYALSNNTTGTYNTANGYGALYRNATGSINTAVGFGALYRNTIGDVNTATGYQALNRNTIGTNNTANGVDALVSNTTGSINTAIGVSALLNNSTGNLNTALGGGAGNNVLTASNVICIGASGADVSNSCFIGNIYGGNEGGTISTVYINSNGQLGTQAPPSSRRFKKEIKPMDHASEAVLALKPVTFHYKSDAKDTPQFGLIAEEVAEVNPELVVHDDKGEIYTVRYEAVNAMLLNEFLKEHRRVQEQNRKIQQQEVTITELKSTVSQQQKGLQAVALRLEKQESLIEKVSAQIQTDKSAPRTVLDDR